MRGLTAGHMFERTAGAASPVAVVVKDRRAAGVGEGGRRRVAEFGVWMYLGDARDREGVLSRAGQAKPPIRPEGSKYE